MHTKIHVYASCCIIFPLIVKDCNLLVLILININFVFDIMVNKID